MPAIYWSAARSRSRREVFCAPPDARSIHPERLMSPATMPRTRSLSGDHVGVAGQRKKLARVPESVDRVIALLLALAIAQLFDLSVAPFTTDSDSYLDVAKNLLAGQGLVMRIVDSWRPAIPDPMGL